MKITVFTSNQPRHLALIRRLSSVSNEIYAVIESNTVFPGLVHDFYRKSEVMQVYFKHMMEAEYNLFGDLDFLPSNVRTLSVKSGDLNLLSKSQLSEALISHVYVVFGASYIKGWLIDFLVANGAINIHMGISPYYRGSSCNFWALFHQRPNYIGSTIHALSKGLDSGSILYHALPEFNHEEPFSFTMKAVEAAQRSLVDRISSKELLEFAPVKQDRSMELSYTRNADFTDDVAKSFLDSKLNSQDLKCLLEESEKPRLLNPFFS